MPKDDTHANGSPCARFSPDRTQILLLGGGSACLVDATSGEQTDTLPGFVADAAFSADEKKLLLLSSNNAMLFDAANKREPIEVCTDTNIDPEELGSFSADSRHFAVADGASVKIYDCSTGALATSLNGALPHISAVEYSPDGKLLAAACCNGTICLFRVNEDHRMEELKETVETGATSVRALAFHPDGRRLLAACGDGTLRELDLHTRSCLHTLSDVPGLFVCGLDLSELRSHDLTAEDQSILRACGATAPEAADADT